jgi:hypothetical protein
MSEFTPLREAVDTLARRTSSPDFGELKRRATRRGRRRIAMVAAAATAAVIAGSALAVTGLGDRRTAPDPVEQPEPSSEAERIIAEGQLYDYDAHDSGVVLTVWTTCQNEIDTDCGHAWRLGTGAEPLATGILAQGEAHAYVPVHAGEDGFVLTTPIPLGNDTVSLRVGLDGTVTSLSECRGANPPLEPGRLVWDWTMVLDMAGVFCPTRFGGGDWHDDGVVARPLSDYGAFTADGTLWAMVSNEGGLSPEQLTTPTQTIGKYDGTRWGYRDLALEGPSWESRVAAAGSNVVVLSKRGISVTTDDGATWHEVTDPHVLERDLPFLTYEAADCCDTSMAFAGSSTLYIADARGGLWRSTDFATFSQIEAPAVYGLKSAGDDVLARDRGRGGDYAFDTDDLVRIAADGSVEVLTVR